MLSFVRVGAGSSVLCYFRCRLQLPFIVAVFFKDRVWLLLCASSLCPQLWYLGSLSLVFVSLFLPLTLCLCFSPSFPAWSMLPVFGKSASVPLTEASVTHTPKYCQWISQSYLWLACLPTLHWYPAAHPGPPTCSRAQPLCTLQEWLSLFKPFQLLQLSKSVVHSSTVYRCFYHTCK